VRRQRIVARFAEPPFGVPAIGTTPQWSPSGNRILYREVLSGIETISARGRRVRTLEVPYLTPSWSPDGREIVAVDATSSPYSLVHMRTDGSRRERIDLPTAGSVWLPQWSPSGRWILYGTTQPDDRSAIWRVRPDGTGGWRLARGTQFSWAPDGRRIAFSYGPHIWSMRADGTRRRLLRRGPRNSLVVSIAWSPNGRRIALVRQRPADAHDTSTVASIPAGGGRERRHFGGTRFIGAISWQPR
jgi:Tol biopolymer transport system component